MKDNNSDIESEWIVVGTIGGMPIFVHYQDEYQTPHFHVVYDDKPDVCIKLEKAEYLNHGNNAGKLSSTDLIYVKNFLTDERTENLSYWKYLLMLWNDNNPGIQVDENMPVTDYSKLEVCED